MKNNSSIGAASRIFAGLALALAAYAGPAFGAVRDNYYLSDHLATTSAVSDASGEIAALESDAFGSAVGGGEQAARYTGKPYDSDIGAYVFPFRNYRPEEARWMSADPSGFPDGVNGFKYAPRPTSELDPLGLATFTTSQGGYLFSIWYTMDRPTNGSAPTLTSYGVSGLTGAAVIIGFNLDLTGGVLTDVENVDEYDEEGSLLREWHGNFEGNLTGEITIGIGVKDVSFTISAYKLTPIGVKDFFQYQLKLE